MTTSAPDGDESAAKIEYQHPGENKKLSSTAEAACALLGGSSAAMTVYPIDIVKTRIQVQTSSGAGVDGQLYDGLMDGIIKIARSEGIAGLYNGVLSDIVKAGVTNYSYFLWYSFFKKVYARSRRQRAQPRSTSTQAPAAHDSETSKRAIPIWLNLAMGVLAGSLTALTINPLNVTQTRIQTRSSKAVDAGFSLPRTMYHIAKTSGFTSLYEGMLPSLVLTLNPAIQFLIFDRLKLFYRARALRARKQLNPKCTDSLEDVHLTLMETFLMGAIAKCVATVLTYPYIFSKVKLQHQASSKLPRGQTFSGTTDVIMSTIRSEGFLGVFAGLRSQIVKSILGGACMLMYKEKYEQVFMAMT